MKHVFVVAALAVLAAAPAAAQQPAPRDTAMHHVVSGNHVRMMEMGAVHKPQVPQAGMQHDSAIGCGMMSGSGMMAAMATDPAHLLAMKADLRLTADQEGRITAIRDAARTGHDAAMQSGEMHAGELATAMQAAAPDTATVRMHFEAAHAAMGRAHLVMLEVAAQARAVLTDAQRRQVDGMHGGMGQPQSSQPAHRH
jgi:Spy/CpxP family protein refolding chaperone